MTIHLPGDLERSIEAAVHSGRFASVDDAMAEAARLLLRSIEREPPAPKPDASKPTASPGPLLGCMREDAELMDEIVIEAYRHQREEAWRELELR